eukprot:TRINITY_DN1127_c0_g1_i1.p1 TRINITY_DN1127_c0_g1~~TRINITY_DN1127_c0_g1_i1.p1  ORF type:complete len:105 (+),score=35.58 TRINITY_DN1127_c0_g1_i1:79-393(+)
MLPDDVSAAEHMLLVQQHRLQQAIAKLPPSPLLDVLLRDVHDMQESIRSDKNAEAALYLLEYEHGQQHAIRQESASTAGLYNTRALSSALSDLELYNARGKKEL